MSTPDRAAMLELIGRSIQASPFHIYIVSAGTVPRFAYTIGVRQSLGAELILAGAIYYSADDVYRTLHVIRERLVGGASPAAVLSVDGLGSFRLHKAHRSWTGSLLLGALDYYRIGEVDAYQVVPDDAHWTVDIPDMEKAWSATAEPVWQWLREAWPYDVSPKSTATTNLDALRGARITEATRWQETEWEMFAGPGPDVTYEEARVVPLGCLLAADPSLRPVVDLEIGKGLWRDDDGSDWTPWVQSS